MNELPKSHPSRLDESCSSRPLSPAQWRALVAAAPVEFRVSGVSMIPTLKEGDRVLIEPLPDHPLGKGQIAAFWRDGGLVVHRYLGNGFFRGDGLGANDPPIPPAHVVGLVRRVRNNRGEHPLPACMPPRSLLRRVARETGATFRDILFLLFRRPPEAPDLDPVQSPVPGEEGNTGKDPSPILGRIRDALRKANREAILLDPLPDPTDQAPFPALLGGRPLRLLVSPKTALSLPDCPDETGGGEVACRTRAIQGAGWGEYEHLLPDAAPLQGFEPLRVPTGSARYTLALAQVFRSRGQQHPDLARVAAIEDGLDFDLEAHTAFWRTHDLLPLILPGLILSARSGVRLPPDCAQRIYAGLSRREQKRVLLALREFLHGSRRRPLRRIASYAVLRHESFRTVFRRYRAVLKSAENTSRHDSPLSAVPILDPDTLGGVFDV